ncbi:MAG: membrane protein insertion efficiency factor YidD [candidate division Zixibacteria bacterium]|nr:membrane protein insertion efficiency factor YidD [Candidatus Tariuqbacter arcticus]
MFQFTSQATIKAAVCVISAYQAVISPLLGGNCRFYPTCSQYAKEALAERGLINGMFLSAKRILKCNPFHPGGMDSVPKRIINQKTR